MNLMCSLNSSQEIKIPSLKDPIKLDGKWLILSVMNFLIILRILIYFSFVTHRDMLSCSSSHMVE